MEKLEKLKQALEAYFSEAEDGVFVEQAADGLVLVLPPPAQTLPAVFDALRERFNFSQLLDIVGIDYSSYNAGNASAAGGRQKPPARFAAVYHLLSVADNRRLRLRAFCADDSFPRLPSATAAWRAADWYEREVFDLFGIVFEGHEDLRRLLTDYGFVGHPFRKDFPLSGHVEMRYDPQQKRVIYQPVTIPPREITPRIVREDGYGDEQEKT